MTAPQTTPEREAFWAIEYAANEISDAYMMADFVQDFVARDFDEFLWCWSDYSTWRDDRATASIETGKSP